MNKAKAEKLSDEELVTLAQAGDETAGAVLVGRYGQMVKNIANARYFKRYGKDLEGELWLAFWELVKQYPVDDRSFGEMAVNRLYFRRMNFHRGEKLRLETELGYNEALDSMRAYETDMLGRISFEEFLESLQLSSLEKEIASYLACGGYSRCEIAQRVGVCHQFASRIVNRLRKRIEKEMTKK